MQLGYRSPDTTNYLGTSETICFMLHNLLEETQQV